MSTTRSACLHCGAELEWEEDDAGLEATCPKCHQATSLIVGARPHAAPTPAARRASMGGDLSAPARNRINLAVWIALGFIAVVGLVWWQTGIGTVKEMFGYAPSAVGDALGLVTIILVFTWVVLWIVFPVFMYFHNKRIIALLEEIRDRLRRP